MVSLNLERINSNSPYAVTALRDSMCFRFVTDFGVIYFVSFLEDELKLSDESYQFIIANTNNRKSPRDSKLRRAIMAIVYEFFECSNTTLLYICETGDSKQSMRNRLFEFWYHSSPRKSEFTYMSTNIREAAKKQKNTAKINQLKKNKNKSLHKHSLWNFHHNSFKSIYNNFCFRYLFFYVIL